MPPARALAPQGSVKDLPVGFPVGVFLGKCGTGRKVAERLISQGLRLVLYTQATALATTLQRLAPTTVLARTPRHAAELVRKLAQEAMASHFYPSEVFNVPIYLVAAMPGGSGLKAVVDLLFEPKDSGPDLDLDLRLLQGALLLSISTVPEASIAAVAGRCRRRHMHFVQAAVDTAYSPEPENDTSNNLNSNNDMDEDDPSEPGDNIHMFLATSAPESVTVCTPLLARAAHGFTVLGTDPGQACSLRVARMALRCAYQRDQLEHEIRAQRMNAESASRAAAFNSGRAEEAEQAATELTQELHHANSRYQESVDAAQHKERELQARAKQREAHLLQQARATEHQLVHQAQRTELQLRDQARRNEEQLLDRLRHTERRCKEEETQLARRLHQSDAANTMLTEHMAREDELNARIAGLEHTLYVERQSSVTAQQQSLESRRALDAMLQQEREVSRAAMESKKELKSTLEGLLAKERAEVEALQSSLQEFRLAADRQLADAQLEAASAQGKLRARLEQTEARVAESESAMREARAQAQATLEEGEEAQMQRARARDESAAYKTRIVSLEAKLEALQESRKFKDEECCRLREELKDATFQMAKARSDQLVQEERAKAAMLELETLRTAAVRGVTSNSERLAEERQEKQEALDHLRVLKNKLRDVEGLASREAAACAALEANLQRLTSMHTDSLLSETAAREAAERELEETRAKLDHASAQLVSESEARKEAQRRCDAAVLELHTMQGSMQQVASDLGETEVQLVLARTQALPPNKEAAGGPLEVALKEKSKLEREIVQMRCVLEEHKDRTHKHLEAEQQARAIVEEERDAASQQAVSLKNEVRQLQSEMCRMEADAAESANKQAEDAHSMLNHASSQDINTVQAKLTAEKSLRIAAEEELDKLWESLRTVKRQLKAAEAAKEVAEKRVIAQTSSAAAAETEAEETYQEAAANKASAELHRRRASELEVRCEAMSLELQQTRAQLALARATASAAPRPVATASAAPRPVAAASTALPTWDCDSSASERAARKRAEEELDRVRRQVHDMQREVTQAAQEAREELTFEKEGRARVEKEKNALRRQLAELQAQATHSLHAERTQGRSFESLEAELRAARRRGEEAAEKQAIAEKAVDRLAMELERRGGSVEAGAGRADAGASAHGGGASTYMENRLEVETAARRTAERELAQAKSQLLEKEDEVQAVQDAKLIAEKERDAARVETHRFKECEKQFASSNFHLEEARRAVAQTETEVVEERKKRRLAEQEVIKFEGQLNDLLRQLDSEQSQRRLLERQHEVSVREAQDMRDRLTQQSTRNSRQESSAVEHAESEMGRLRIDLDSLQRKLQVTEELSEGLKQREQSAHQDLKRLRQELHEAKKGARREGKEVEKMAIVASGLADQIANERQVHEKVVKERDALHQELKKVVSAMVLERTHRERLEYESKNLRARLAEYR